MLTILLKKQLMETNSWIFYDRKKDKAKSLSSSILTIVFYIAIFAILAMSFGSIAFLLADSLFEVGLDWYYFSLIALFSIVFGVLGTAFSASSHLYKAKDNDLLLSMPIEPILILVTRVISLWVWAFIYSGLIFIPAVVVYYFYHDFSIATLLPQIIVTIMISLLSLALACVFGYVISEISNRIGNKSYISVLFSLTFLGLYYYFYFKIMNSLEEVINNIILYGAKVKGYILPLYWLGSASDGNYLSLLLFSLLVIALAIIVFIVLQSNYYKVISSTAKSSKKQYKQDKSKSKSVDAALLSKEFKRYLSSSIYMLNSSLASIMMIIAGVFLLIKKADVLELLQEFNEMGLEPLLLLICSVAIITLSSMNIVTTPSVSLEGKNLWIIQSLPIDYWKLIKAKLNIHLLITLIPGLFLVLCILQVINLNLVDGLSLIVLLVVYNIMHAGFGLILGILFPDFNWKSEVAVIKQSFTVLVSMFAGWLLLAIMVFIFIKTIDLITISQFYYGVIGFMILADIIVLWWLKKFGTRKIASY